MPPLLKVLAPKDKTETEPPAAAALRPLAEHPEYKAESAILARIGGEIAALDREVKAIEAARYLREERKAGRDATPHFVQQGSAIELALQILDGVQVDLRTDEERLATGRTKIKNLTPGYRAQREKLERIRDRLSAEICQSLRERHRKTLANLLTACRMVARAAAAERQVYADIYAAGYQPMDHILPASQCGPVLAFDETSFASPLSHFRRQLESLGVIP
jgi:hypothetical protein